jgi:hypothetical protein
MHGYYLQQQARAGSSRQRPAQQDGTMIFSSVHGWSGRTGEYENRQCPLYSSHFSDEI